MTRRPSAGEIIDNFTREINNGKGNNSNVSYNNSNINININGDNHVKIKLQRNPSTPAPTSSAKLEKITKSKSLPASGASLQRLGIPPLSKVQNNSIYSNKSTKSSKSTYSTHSGYSSGYTQKTEDTDSICSAEHDDHEDRHIHCSGDGSKAKHAEGDGQQFAKIPDMHSFHGGTTADPSFSNNGDAGERLHRQAQSFHGGDRDRSLGRQGSGNSNTFASARRGSDTSLNCRRSSGRKYGGTRGFDVCPESTLLDLDGDIDKGRDGMADKLVNSRFHRIFNEEEFQRPRMSRQRNSYHDRSSHQDLSYGNYNTRRDIYDHRNRDQFDQEFHDNTTNQNQNGDSPRQRSFQYRPSKFSQSSSDILDGSSRRRSKHRSKSRDFGRSYNATSSGSDWDDHPNSSRRPRNSCSINNNNNNIDNNNNYDNNNERNRKCYERNKRRSNFSIDNRRASTESNPFPPEKVVSGGPIRQGSGSALYDTGPGSNSSKVPPPPPPPPSRFNNSSSNGSDHCRNNNNSNSNANPSSRTNAKGLKNDVNCTNDNNINTSNFSTYRVDELADRLINFSKRSSINNDPPRTSNANTTAITTAINSSAEGILKNPPPPPPRRANDDDNNNNSNLINRSSGPSSNLNSNSNLNLNHLNANSNTTSLAPNSPLPSMEEEVNDNSSFIEHVFAGVGGVIHTTSAEFNNSFTSLSISNSSVGNSGVSTTNNTFENNKATANNNSNNGSHPTTPIETMAPRPVRISQFIDLDETADDYHHSLPGSGSNNGSNPSTPTVSIMNASTLTSTIQNQQQQQHGNAIATKITVENSDALPSTCDKKGRCVRHPMVKLYKKKLLGGYEMIRDVCPKCEAEAPYEDLWKKRSRNINNNGGNVAVNSTPVRNRDRDEPVTTDLGHNSGNGNNRDDSIGDGDGNSHYDESQNSPFLPMHNLDSETQPQTQAPNSANRPKRLSRLANASFEISTTNSSINNNNKNNTRQRSASAGRASSIGRKSSRVGGSSVANESRAGDMASEIVSGHSLLDKGLGKLSKIHNKAMSHLNEGVTALTEKKSNEKFHVFDRKTGRCLRHPSIILAKKSTFKKGWDYVQPNGTCPLCLEAEANTSRRSASRGKESKGEKPEDDRGSEFSFSQDQIGSSGSGKPYRRKASEDLSFMSNNGAMTASPKVTPKARVATVAEGDSFQDYGNDGLIMDTAPPKETTARPSKKLNKPRRNNNNVNESIVDVIPYSSGINTPGNRSSRVSKMPYNTPWGESGWYTGEVNEAGVPHGQGRMRFKTGNSFEGQWVDGYSEQFLENRGRLKKGFGTNVAPWKQNTVEKNSPLTSGGRGVMSTSKMSSMPAPPFSMHQERSRGIPSYPQPMTYPPHQPHYRPGPVPPPPIFEQQNYPPQYPSPPHQGGMMPPFPPQSQPPPQQQWYGGEGGNGPPPPMGHPAYPPGFHPSR